MVLRDRENLVLLTPFEEGMVLYKLRNPDEVRSMTEVPKVGDIGKVDDEQLKMAQTLVDQMSKPFEKINTSDSYLEALREIIDAKIEGKEVVSYVAEEPEVVDIMTALKESISKAKADKKPMEKAGRKKREEAQGKKKKTG